MKPRRRDVADLLLPDVLIVEDLSHHLHYAKSTIRALMRSGVLPAKKVGRRWFMDRRALLRALAADDGQSALRLVRHRGDAQ